MWSTSLSCLYSLDALNAKKRCGIVYFQWTYFLHYCVFFTSFIVLFELSLAQKISPSEYTTGFDGIAVEDLTTEEIPEIRQFYNENNNMKLNITLKKFVDTGVLGYNISVYRVGPPKLHKCSTASEHYEILTNDPNIIIPTSEVQNSFFLSRCTYRMEIIPLSENKIFQIKYIYTIPDTSAVSNISAFAFYDAESNGIKLHVKWENPTVALLPTHYQIKMSPFKVDKEYCEQNTKFQEVYKPAKISSVTLPEDIVPGCSYTIVVEEQPSNDLNPPGINYTVPDCVEEHCICQYKNPRSPPPIIEVEQISNNMLRISWKIPKLQTMGNLTMIKFRLFVPQHISTPLVLYTRNITDQDVDVEMKENITVPSMLTGHVIVQVWYINASFCDSAHAKIDHIAQHVPGSYVTYQIMVLTMFILIVIVVLCLLWKNKFSLCLSSRWICYRLRGQHTTVQPHIRKIYRPTIDGSRIRSYLSVPMEYNNIYVEKEIADEYERGRVDKFEVSYKRLHFERKIGGGAFGEVFLARTTAIVGSNFVAVKKLPIENASPEELEEFLLEITMLKRIGQHPNIVTLLGCCTLRQPYCMIMEYVPCGDLLRYLRALRLQYEQKGKAFLFTFNKSFDTTHSQERQKISECSYITPGSIPSSRLPSVTETEYTLLGSDIGAPTTPEVLTPRSPIVLEYSLDPRELQNFAMQIARGMQYLEQKQIVHRDLAARNVLIDENKTLKISDFGLSRSGIYVNSKQKKLPLRWLSVEAIRDNLYTNKSDVWAYGIVLWEISTLGGFPYPTVADNEILGFLLKGKRLEMPENCTDELYELMQKCWSHTNDERPSFTKLVEWLEVISSKRRVYVDFNQLNPSYMFPPMEEQINIEIEAEDNVKTIEIH